MIIPYLNLVGLSFMNYFPPFVIPSLVTVIRSKFSSDAQRDGFCVSWYDRTQTLLIAL